ncbi:hypothetical protein [Dysosmobacter sp.]|uniref:hypothetical protein n=1 Tax=Dysosmobacter sp. TaxID=2591382 RepID=UPI002A99947B|nr:hypothetical protein [Dysosmobacter sp.]MDY5509712.1 hypothetical protein [Dysosmobacter sp.]
MQEHKSGLQEAADVAGTVHGAFKTGKAISAAAKGAAAGGPYGAAAGALWGTRKHLGKILAAVMVLLLLPVLFVLMLPSLIFGGLTSSGTDQPILNDNAAITAHVDQMAFSINQILGEGIDDAKARIAQDFAATDGDQYEVIDPYEGNLVSNTNLFLAQYCAAKDTDWAAISQADLEQLLRQGKNQLYSYT